METMDIVGVDWVAVWVKNDNHDIVLLHLGAQGMLQSQFLSKKKPRQTLQYFNVPQLHRVLTDFLESSITLFSVNVAALNLNSCSLNGC